jgi:hypothetical protein
MSSKPDLVFDKRTIARNLKRNKLTRKELEQYLASLEDAASKAVPMFSAQDITPKSGND